MALTRLKGSAALSFRIIYYVCILTTVFICRSTRSQTPPGTVIILLSACFNVDFLECQNDWVGWLQTSIPSRRLHRINEEVEVELFTGRLDNGHANIWTGRVRFCVLYRELDQLFGGSVRVRLVDKVELKYIDADLTYTPVVVSSIYTNNNGQSCYTEIGFI